MMRVLAGLMILLSKIVQQRKVKKSASRHRVSPNKCSRP